MTIALLAALAVTAAPAAALGPPAVAERTPGETSWVSTYAGWTVWSEREGGRYVLLARHAGRTKVLPAPRSVVTHDPGAGRGPGGRATAVYQRCTGARCAIWAVDLASGRQRRVRDLGTVRRLTAAASVEDQTGPETHPRIWGGRVAFQTRAGGATRLRVGPSAAGRGRVRTLPGRPRADGDLTQLALGPRHVVGLWENDLCFGACVGLYIDGIASRRQRVLDEGAAGEVCIAVLDGLGFDGRAFRWTRELTAESSGDTGCPPTLRRRRYDPRTGRTTGG